jgi:hypothetical protein
MQHTVFIFLAVPSQEPQVEAELKGPPANLRPSISPMGPWVHTTPALQEKPRDPVAGQKANNETRSKKRGRG